MLVITFVLELTSTIIYLVIALSNWLLLVVAHGAEHEQRAVLKATVHHLGAVHTLSVLNQLVQADLANVILIGRVHC